MSPAIAWCREWCQTKRSDEQEKDKKMEVWKEECTAFLCSVHALMQASHNTEMEEKIFPLDESTFTFQLAVKFGLIAADAPRERLPRSLFSRAALHFGGTDPCNSECMDESSHHRSLYSPGNSAARVVKSLKNMLSLLNAEEIDIVAIEMNQKGADDYWNENNLKRAAVALQVAIENSQHNEEHFVDRCVSMFWLVRKDAMSDKQLGHVLLGANGIAPYVLGHSSSSSSESKSPESKSLESNAEVQEISSVSSATGQYSYIIFLKFPK